MIQGNQIVLKNIFYKDFLKKGIKKLIHRRYIRNANAFHTHGCNVSQWYNSI